MVGLVREPTAISPNAHLPQLHSMSFHPTCTRWLGPTATSPNAHQTQLHCMWLQSTGMGGLVREPT
eukprot:CAMPEP_0118927072 /NCGR_PEP_ID=MMETSP1169-20130426/4638_1 /TAXON_ID=36882 /ORGANISM="Pyramimonas obovata, Strain CCMP722" /LENGTH=65 /DNA_ID=CAMNT_0006868765 /DNA_START=1 /DNA_END=194 /DNA_ORIENTATION=+